MIDRVAVSHKYSIAVSSGFDDGISRLVEGLDEEFSGASVGNIWQTAEVIVRSGVDWCGWWTYHDGLRQAYLAALDGKLEYRYGKWITDKERRADMWSHNELAFSLGRKHYIPEEVPMPTFVEGDSSSPSVFRRVAEDKGVSMDVMHEYFLKSFESQQVLRGTDAYEYPTWHALREIGMIVNGDSIPIAAAIGDLSMVEARIVLGALKEKPERSLSLNVDKLLECARDDKGAVLSALASIRDWNETYYVYPPMHLTWSDFQSLRQQVKGMAVAIGDLYFDIIKRKHPVDHAKLVGNGT